MEKHKANVAENDKVVMIHVSLDQSEDAAEAWAEKEGFPWYTVLNKDVARSGLMEYKTTQSVPEYALLNAAGERLGSGGRVFSQVKKLTE